MPLESHFCFSLLLFVSALSADHCFPWSTSGCTVAGLSGPSPEDLVKCLVYITFLLLMIELHDQGNFIKGERCFGICLERDKNLSWQGGMAVCDKSGTLRASIQGAE